MSIRLGMEGLGLVMLGVVEKVLGGLVSVGVCWVGQLGLVGCVWFSLMGKVSWVWFVWAGLDASVVVSGRVSQVR